MVHRSSDSRSTTDPRAAALDAYSPSEAGRCSYQVEKRNDPKLFDQDASPEVLMTDQLDRSLRLGNVRFAKLYEEKGSVRSCGNRHAGWVSNDRVKGNDRPLLPALASRGWRLNGELASDVFDQLTSRGMTGSIRPHRSASPVPIANLCEGFCDPKHGSLGVRWHQDQRRPLPAQSQKPQLLQLQRG